MSDRKPKARREGAEHEGYHYPPEHHPPPHYHGQSAPPPHPMSAYATYPPRHPYGHPPLPYGGWHPGMRADPMSSPPADGFHPPYPRYPPRPNPTAVTPEQAQMMPPAEFMSPPSNVKKRPYGLTSSLSPSKRVRAGKISLTMVVLLDPLDADVFFVWTPA